MNNSKLKHASGYWGRDFFSDDYQNKMVSGIVKGIEQNLHNMV